MFFSILSDISQNNTKMLEQQYQEIQRKHKEEQLLQACLEEVAEACHIEQAIQKARNVAKIKIREKAKK